MNWNAISAISETIASIAVVISLIYVALQIRQSNKLSQSQTRTDLRHMAQAEVSLYIEHPEIFQANYKENLSEEERIQLNYHLISAMRFREFIWRQFNLGLLDEATFRNYLRVVPQLLGNERCRRWWDGYKGTTFDPVFIDFVDRMLAENPLQDMREILDAL